MGISYQIKGMEITPLSGLKKGQFIVIFRL